MPPGTPFTRSCSSPAARTAGTPLAGALPPPPPCHPSPFACCLRPPASPSSTTLTLTPPHPTHTRARSLLFWLASRAAPQAEVRGAHEASIWAAAWHPAGHLLATGSGDFATKFWCRWALGGVGEGVGGWDFGWGGGWCGWVG